MIVKTDKNSSSYKVQHEKMILSKLKDKKCLFISNYYYDVNY